MLHIFKSYFTKSTADFDLTIQTFKDRLYPDIKRLSDLESVAIAQFLVNGRTYSFEYNNRYPGRSWDTLNIYLIDDKEKILLYSESGTLYCIGCTDRVNFKMPGKWWDDLDQIKEGMCEMNRLALLKFEEKRKKEQEDLREKYRKLEEKLFNG